METRQGDLPAAQRLPYSGTNYLSITKYIIWNVPEHTHPFCISGYSGLLNSNSEFFACPHFLSSLESTMLFLTSMSLTYSDMSSKWKLHHKSFCGWFISLGMSFQVSGFPSSEGCIYHIFIFQSYIYLVVPTSRFLWLMLPRM